MNTIVGTVENEKVEISGINAVLTLWAFNSKLGKKLFLKNQNVKNSFLKSFSNIDRDRSYLFSKKLIEEFWGSYPCLGPLPLISELSAQQFEGIHHSEYRDHISHTFKVFVLGLYIYDNCRYIKEQVHKEILSNSSVKVNDIENDFIKLWTICSLSHDIGYVLESEKTDPGLNSELYPRIAETINKILENPIAYTYFFRKMNFSKEIESTVVDNFAIPISKINSYQRIGIFRNRDLLVELDKFAEVANLGEKGKSPIFRRYYDFAHKNKPTVLDRDKFLDHGITSSLLLMHVWASFKERIHYILKENNNESLTTPFLAKLIEINDEIEVTQNLIVSAAGAIALHNINLRIWNKDDLMSWKLYSGLLSIKLASSHSVNNDNLSLAFLLILSDTLQDWDRFKFREPKMNDLESQLLSEDFFMEVINDKLFLSYIKDYTGPSAVNDPKNHKNSNFNKMKNALVKVLHKETIEDLIDCGLGDNLIWGEIDLEKIYDYKNKTKIRIKVDNKKGASLFDEDNKILNYINAQIKKYKRIEKTYVELGCLSKIEKNESLKEEINNKYDASLKYILKDFLPKDTVIENFESIEEVLKYHRRIMLLGPPGSGKTTTLKCLVCRSSIKIIDEKKQLIPLYVDLSSWPDSVVELRSLINLEKNENGLNNITNDNIFGSSELSVSMVEKKGHT